MQPDQQQPTDWQQPAQSPPAAPFQAPVAEPAPEPRIQVVPQVPVAQPITPSASPQPVQPVAAQETPVQQAVPEVSGVAESIGEPSVEPPSEIPTEQPLPSDDEALLRWQGTEYIHSTRSIKWYVIFGIITVLAVVAAIMLLKSITFAILIPVMVVALLVYVRRAPDVLQYILSRKGIHVNDKLFTYDQFKAFGVVSYNGSHSVVLTPRKRFQIGQTLYFPEEVGEQLVDMLAERLPMQEVAPDAIDRLLARLHL